MAKLLIAIGIFALVLCTSQAKSFHGLNEMVADAYRRPARLDNELQAPAERGIFEDEEKEDLRHLMEAKLDRGMQFDFADLQARKRGIFEDEENEELRHPMEAMLERGMQFDFAEDGMEAFVNTKRLLDAVLRDGGTVQGGTAIYRFGSGENQECINGKKSIPAMCQWTGLVQWSGEDEVQKTKLTVAGKYCTQAGLLKPKKKKVDC